VSCLQQPVLHLDVSVRQQSAGSLDESVLQQSVLSLDILCFCSTAISIPGGVWPSAACASLGHNFFNSSLCCVCRCMTYLFNWACLSTRAFVCSWGVCLQESVYNSFVLNLDVSVYQSLCCTCACLFTRVLSCTLPGHF
jgi:hypothetical protein